MSFQSHNDSNVTNERISHSSQDSPNFIFLWITQRVLKIMYFTDLKNKEENRHHNIYSTQRGEK